jgi:hypothetical protein
VAKVEFDEFLAYIEAKRTDEANDGRLIAALDAADAAVDDWCGRVIAVAPAEASARSFRPAGNTRSFLPIYDCVSITSVVENSVTLTANTSYVAEPLNGIDPTGQTVPYDGLSKVSGYWHWNGPVATVTISARWGWASIPPQVAEATKMLAKDIASARSLRGDVAGFGEFGMVRIRQSPQIQGLLGRFRRTEAWGIA